MCTRKEYKSYIVDRIQNDVGMQIAAHIQSSTGREAASQEILVTKEKIENLLGVYLKTNGNIESVDYSRVLGIDVHESKVVQGVLRNYEDLGYLERLYYEERISSSRVSVYGILIPQTETKYMELYYLTEKEREVVQRQMEIQGVERMIPYIEEKLHKGEMQLSSRRITDKRGKIQKRYIGNKEEIVEYEQIR